MLGEHIAHVIGHGAEIFAHHQAVHAGGFDREDRDHRLMVVGDVRAAACTFALRNPPQAEQAEHMVDAHRARVRKHVVHHFAVHAVTGFGEIIRIERRLSPILALLVVEVRRAAHGDAADGETFRIPPHVGAQRMHAHGHVLHEAQCHAAFARGGLCGGHLFVGDPLQPAFEVDHIGMIV